MANGVLRNKAQEKQRNAAKRELGQLLDKVSEAFGVSIIHLFKDLCIKLLGFKGQFWKCALQRFARKEADVFQDFESYNCFRGLWKQLYAEYLGLGVSFQHVVIPAMPTGRNWGLIVTTPRLKIAALYDRLISVIGELVYFDKLVAVKKPTESQAVWLRLGRKVENFSANDLVENGRSHLYLEDVILFLVAYFEQHGKRLNLDGVRILCSASAANDGRVIMVEGTKTGLTISLVNPAEKQEGLLQLEKAE